MKAVLLVTGKSQNLSTVSARILNPQIDRSSLSYPSDPLTLLSQNANLLYEVQQRQKSRSNLSVDLGVWRTSVVDETIVDMKPA